MEYRIQDESSDDTSEVNEGSDDLEHVKTTGFVYEVILYLSILSSRTGQESIRRA